MAKAIEIVIEGVTYTSKSEVVRALFKKGKTCAEISKMTGINYVHAYQVINKMKDAEELAANPVESKIAAKVDAPSTSQKETVEKSPKKKTLADVTKALKHAPGLYGSVHGNNIEWDGKTAFDVEMNEEVPEAVVLFDMPITTTN